MAHIPSFEEFVQGQEEVEITEGFKSKLAGTLGGALLAGGLNASPTDNPGDEDKYNFNKTEQYVDTIPSSYTSKQIDKYKQERAFNSYKDVSNYEKEHTHSVPFPVWDKRNKNIRLGNIYTGHYNITGDADEFFDNDDLLYIYSKNQNVNAKIGELQDKVKNNKVDFDDPYFSFKIIKRGPKNKDGYIVNDALGIKLTVRDVDKFLQDITNKYTVTKAGDTKKKKDDELFQNKDMTEWFNIVPKGSVRRIASTKPKIQF